MQSALPTSSTKIAQPPDQSSTCDFADEFRTTSQYGLPIPPGTDPARTSVPAGSRPPDCLIRNQVPAPRQPSQSAVERVDRQAERPIAPAGHPKRAQHLPCSTAAAIQTIGEVTGTGTGTR